MFVPAFLLSCPLPGKGHVAGRGHVIDLQAQKMGRLKGTDQNLGAPRQNFGSCDFVTIPCGCLTYKHLIVNMLNHTSSTSLHFLIS